jgi:hypothetical protein
MWRNVAAGPDERASEGQAKVRHQQYASGLDQNQNQNRNTSQHTKKKKKLVVAPLIKLYCFCFLALLRSAVG